MAEKQEVTLETKVDKAIDDLMAIAFRPGSPPKSEDALRHSQAILNLAHAKQLLTALKK